MLYIKFVATKGGECLNTTNLVRDKKNYMLRVRMNDETLKKLDECAETKETTRSDIVRQGIEIIHEQIKKES